MESLLESTEDISIPDIILNFHLPHRLQILTIIILMRLDLPLYLFLLSILRL